VTQFIQQVINGLTIGVGYAVVGSGLTIVFGLLRVMNFAHGEFFTLGAFGLIWAASLFGLSYWVAAPVSVIFVVLFSAVIYWLLLKPSTRNDRGDGTTSLMVTYGLSLVMLNVIQAMAGPDPKAISTGLVAPLLLGKIIVPAQQVVVVIAGVIIFVLLAMLLRLTLFGKKLRAVSQNETGAALVGIKVDGIKAAGFMIGSGLAGLGGVLVAPAGLVTPSSGQSILFTSFIVVILGGLGSVPGAALAGVLLGLVQALGSAYVSSQWTTAYGFALLLLMLAVRPTGLAGSAAGMPSRRRARRLYLRTRARLAG
jgi:branched-chain amino acid transport system permease protein